MTISVDFEECLKDSLKFRASIEGVETEVTELEVKLEKLVKLCNAMLEAGRTYGTTARQFVNGIRELSTHCSGDEMMSGCLEKFSNSLNHMIDHHTTLIEVTQKSVKQHLFNFIKEDVRKFKDTKKHFDKSSEDLENALNRNAQVPPKKQHEVDEATNTLQTARRSFRHISLDYVLQINVIQAKKRNEMLQFMVSLMGAQSTFFTQGFDTLNSLDAYKKQLAEQLHQLVLNSARDKRDMEQRHAAIKQKDVFYDDLVVEFNMEAPNGVVMEGYLYKRASNAFKTWNRRWFSIQNNQLVYQKKLKDNLTVVVEDLRLCTVKSGTDCERRFCFEVVSPSKSCMLQADSERHQQNWILAVQSSIATAFNERREDSYSKLERTSSVSTGIFSFTDEVRPGKEKGLEQVQSIPGNAHCCDCNEALPEWASINLGITLCIECSGIHRSLGVHFSKVRSLTLDSWEPELLKLMCELGNSTINGIYEARVEEMTVKKPHPGSPRQEKEAWIRAKYVEKKFIHKLPESGIRLRRCSLKRNQRANTLEKSQKPEKPPKPFLKPKGKALPPSQGVNDKSGDSSEDLRDLHPGALLYRAAALQNLPVMADALAHGANVNWVNASDENKTPLIQAVTPGSLVACEFLLQNGANVNLMDSHKRGPLHHATVHGHTGLVCLFLKRGASQTALDENGKNPITIAIDAANADIVTLLRLARMNEEMREAEGAFGPTGDETYNDIFRDFSHMASNNPEKLKRKSHELRTSTL
ncbi:arf-GAP with coiled-coil, ANK repeat and PH domain-containing protein 1 isoform X2 [Scyliorhinus canicula]|uniref:arf-GAP with coiled-coil, ANK repeat and PH domain-containing protein 1 isoform X2 n=1 Tax=Scyliorhinus canicula TaxID=7830 RepID=UPI0018F50D81|nr:arf-GAP with coiled-coil, ANK repeat and PH domain-containing protein 1 isoform X2 [Scyliorhinus canicula]